jgi:hypothetical protein
MKGIVVTLDAMVAMVIAIFVITATMQLLSKPPASQDDYLYKYSLDVLTVATKDGSLAAGFNGNWTKFQGLTDRIDSKICYNITVFDKHGSLAYNRTRACGNPQQVIVAKRVLTNRSRVFTSVMEAWYK